MTAKAQFPQEQSAEGHFVRQPDAFRDWVRADGSSAFPAVAGRYHLYVSLACPWAHRTIIMRKLRGLEGAIGMTVADPVRDERGWAFREGPGCSRDPVNGFGFLREAYAASDPAFRGRFTVPVLWDTQSNRIVSNSDDDILRMFETEFEALAANGLDFYPPDRRADIDRLNEEIYETVNDGVYRAGFATSQRAYEHAARRVFATLDTLEERLRTSRYLFGPQPLETDWRLFVTLVRFDAVYYGHFKCNLRRVADYENLYGYLRDLYQYDGVAQTVDFDHIKRHYYYTHEDLNPTRIVPIGPLQDLNMPHHRERLAV
ncbi:MAG: glutathione S-transferase family protein [Vulcanimicrobiaceae bacterium]